MIVQYAGNAIRLPDFLIIGAAKSGTTSLYHYLKQHPQVFMPEIKEPWFFSFMDNPPRFTNSEKLPGVISDIREYTRLFDEAKPGQISGEASPSYLYTHEVAIDNIKKVYGEQSGQLKIIAILRHPAERAWSQYLHFRKFAHEPLAFEKAVDPAVIEQRMKEGWNIFFDYLGFGRYESQVKAWQKAFSQMLVLLYEDLKTDEAATVRRIFEFLGVDPTFTPPNIKTTYNISGIPESWLQRTLWKILYHPNPVKRFAATIMPGKFKERIYHITGKRVFKRQPMPQEMRRQLTRYYEEDILELQQILQRDLTHWLR